MFFKASVPCLNPDVISVFIGVTVAWRTTSQFSYMDNSEEVYCLKPISPGLIISVLIFLFLSIFLKFIFSLKTSQVFANNYNIPVDCSLESWFKVKVLPKVRVRYKELFHYSEGKVFDGLYGKCGKLVSSPQICEELRHSQNIANDF